jgi:ABC-type xylose transport system permease subunit
VSTAAQPLERAPASPGTSRPQASALRRFLRRRELVLVILTLAVFFITYAVNSGFANGGYISFMLADAMPLAILAVGQTIVCLVRGIDLSVAGTLGLVAVATGFLGCSSSLRGSRRSSSRSGRSSSTRAFRN